MGILSTIRKNLEHAGEKKFEAGEEKKSAEEIPRVKKSEPLFFDPPADPPCVCLECWSPTFWRSRYGGALRCAICEPWPSLALVGERWTLYTQPGGSLAWIPCLLPGERTSDRRQPSEQSADLPGWITYQDEDESGLWLIAERVGE